MRRIRIVAGNKKWKQSYLSFTELGLLLPDQFTNFQIGEFFYHLGHGIRPPTYEGHLQQPLIFIHSLLGTSLHTCTIAPPCLGSLK